MSTSSKRPTILRGIQRHFQRHVLAGCKEIATHITDTGSAGSDARLAVYAEGYRHRLAEALTVDFPALRTLLGESKFDVLVRGYIAKHPSAHFSTRFLGNCFSEFLANNSAYAKTPALSELAEFEWQLRTAFDAADADIYSVDDIGAIEPSKWGCVQLRLHPSVRRLDLAWNVPAIWNAAESNHVLPTPKTNDVPVPWLIWRQDLKTNFRSLTIDEAVSIDIVIAGKSFGEVCEQLCQWIDANSVPSHAARLMKRWASDGLIVDVSFSNVDVGG